MKSPFSDVDIPDGKSLPDFLRGRLARYGHKTALVDGVTGRRVTYAQIHQQSLKLAAALWCQYRLTKGDIVCIVLPNCPEYVILVQAVLLTGAAITTCNPAYKPAELKTQLVDSGTSLVITDRANADTVKTAIGGLRIIKDMILIDGKEESDSQRTVTGLLRESNHAVLPQVNINPRDDVALVFYSSGTTGQPKGVMLTHYNCIASILQFTHPALDMGGPDDVYLVVTPMFHIYGMNVVLQSGLYLGATLIILTSFHPETYLRCIEKYQVTFLHLAPPLVLFLSQHPLVDAVSTKSVRVMFCGAAPLPENVSQAAQKRIGGDLRQGYGMTEASPGVLIAAPGTRPYSTVGVPMPNTEVKIVDINTGVEVSANQTGEILMRGPQVMKGYLGNCEATAQTINKEGWLRTGDIGYRSEDGLHFIVDRLKELIKYKAFQVAPAELENVLLSHPAVEDAAVVGRPHGALGELPTAFVVTRGSVSADAITQFVADKMAPYKELRGGVIFVDVIPKSPSGKILRRVLKQRLLHNNKL